MARKGSEAVRGAVVVAFVFSVLALAGGAFLGDTRWWGVNWYAYLPRYALLPLVGAAVAAYALGRSLDTPGRAHATQSPQPGVVYPLSAALVILIFTAAFLIFRVRTHFLGDGYQLLANLATGGGVVKPWNVAVQFVQQHVKTFFGGAPDAALKTFRVVSIGCGVLGLVAVAVSARYLRASLTDRLLLLVGIATGGFVLLYFGYVENYPLFVTVVLIFLLVGLLALKGVLSRWWVLGPLALAGLCHPYAVALIPAAVYLMLHDTVVGRRLGDLGVSTRWLFAAAAFAAFVVFLYFATRASYFLRFALLPVVPNEFTVDGYTMTSLTHFVDLANLFFMLVPGVLILLTALVMPSFKTVAGTPPYRFLLIAGFFAFALIFIFDPRLGMPRDWDLFSFAGLPPLVLLFYYLTDPNATFQWRRGAAVLSAALGLFVLAPRVATQVDPERSIAVFDRYSENDPIRTGNGRYLLLQYLREHGRDAEAEHRLDVYTAKFRHEVLAQEGEDLLRAGRIRDAMTVLREALKLAPNHPQAWGNLGICYLDLKQYDSAEICMKITDGLNPFNAQSYDNFAFLYLSTGDKKKGEEYCLKALSINPHDINAQGNLAKIYYQSGRVEEYRKVVYAMADEPATSKDFILMAALERLRTNNVQEAVRLYRLALARGADTAYIRDIESKIPGLKIIP